STPLHLVPPRLRRLGGGSSFGSLGGRRVVPSSPLHPYNRGSPAPVTRAVGFFSRPRPARAFLCSIPDTDKSSDVGQFPLWSPRRGGRMGPEPNSSPDSRPHGRGPDWPGASRSGNSNPESAIWNPPPEPGAGGESAP